MFAFAHPGFSLAGIRFEVCDVDFRVLRSTLKVSSLVALPESVQTRTTIDADGTTAGLCAAQSTPNRLTIMIVIGRITLRLSGSPTQLNKEARSWRVRSKRFFGSLSRAAKVPI